MAIHDYIIDNQSAPAFRADLNGALQAIVTQNSNATAPTTTYANMIWYDTAANQLKKRNEANSAWIVLGTIDETLGTFNTSGTPAIATQAEAQAGTDNTKMMTPLRSAQAIAALAPTPTTAGAVGTYALLSFATNTAAAAGSDHAGSGLRYGNASGGSVFGTPSGTWRLMGQTNSTSSAASTSVFLRIA